MPFKDHLAKVNQNRNALKTPKATDKAIRDAFKKFELRVDILKEGLQAGADLEKLQDDIAKLAKQKTAAKQLEDGCKKMSEAISKFNNNIQGNKTGATEVRNAVPELDKLYDTSTVKSASDPAFIAAGRMAEVGDAVVSLYKTWALPKECPKK